MPAKPLLTGASKRHLAAALLAAAACLSVWAGDARSEVRIKDIIDFEGVRDNLLVGYGLIVGLNGTGDTLRNSPFTEQSLAAMLERLGVNTRTEGNGRTLTSMRTRNVAAVMVTATLTPYAAQGTRIDINVAAMGDASSLLGGTLLVTPLIGADGEVYAVAQGPVAVGGFSASGGGGGGGGGNNSSVVRNVPTAGRISSGAIVEREIEFSLAELPVLRLSLRNPDFTTASRITAAINASLRGPFARAADPSSVLLTVPPGRRGNVVGLITEIEQLKVEPDQVARVVIDEKTGVIVMGDNVRISTVAVAQGNLTVRITEIPQVSQPAPFSETGQTVVTNQTDIQVNTDEDRRLAILREGVSLQELVQNLNALGVGPRDMISILQSIKAAGALQAEIEVI